jgi:hypothetical protein
MYCSDCLIRVAEGVVEREGGAGADRFGSLQCQRCGVPLPTHAAPQALGEKLAQLARFGLTGSESRPRGE